MLPYSLAALPVGFLLDLALGDPQGWPHLVRGLGALIAALERLLYPLPNKLLGGALLAICVSLVSLALPAAALYLAYRLSPGLYFVMATLLTWQLLAIKSLRDESSRVRRALERQDLAGARAAVAGIVGRDTGTLDAAGVTRAAVETVAENTADGVAAPLLYLALGGPPLACWYKAVNTMDSLIGYKNDRYLAFGRAAARLDDCLNYLPARLCVLLMLPAARLCRLDAASARRIWLRDRRNHASPNSGQTEAVMAGALHLRLGGNAYYFGRLQEKPYLGDDLRPARPGDILSAQRLLYATAWLLLLAALLIRGCLYVAL